MIHFSHIWHLATSSGSALILLQDIKIMIVHQVTIVLYLPIMVEVVDGGSTIIVRLYSLTVSITTVMQ